MTVSAFLKNANTPWKMRLYMFMRLPGAWFMGMNIHSCDLEQAVVRLPYRWRSKNPFQSIYFAAQCAAAELSTGMLVLAHLQEKPPVSMLVVGFEASFYKKAGETLLFTCTEGAEIGQVIQRAVETGEGQEFVAHSVGRLPDGTVAAEMKVKWSFKKKK